MSYLQFILKYISNTSLNVSIFMFLEQGTTWE